MKLPKVFFVRIYHENVRIISDSTRADFAKAEGPSEEILSLSCTIGGNVFESALSFLFESLPQKDAKVNDLCGRYTSETKNCFKKVLSRKSLRAYGCS